MSERVSELSLSPHGRLPCATNPLKKGIGSRRGEEASLLLGYERIFNTNSCI